ncbi:MAG: hydrogenase iron-sulfur subunit [Candidatus Kryptoniota bacterium]
MISETRVGVYLCSGCGIGECINLDRLKKVATDENKVHLCTVRPWLCSQEAIEEIKGDIVREGLNRVVIGACSPRSVSDVFKFSSGILVDRVNLREDVAWTHRPDDEDTQMLAEDYLRMGIVKLRNSEAPEPVFKEVSETILVVGGGISGLTSALSAAAAGHPVVLVEKESELGGWVEKFYKITPYESPYTDPQTPDIKALISNVESNPNIRIFKSTTIKKISGQPGNFNVTLEIKGESQTEVFTAGAIVQATGWKPYDPNKLKDLGYGASERVLTNVEVEQLFKEDKFDDVLQTRPLKSIAFIQCAGSRDEKHLPYCSTICCSVSLKQALYIRERYPDALIYIIYRDMRTPSQQELFYRRVQEEENVFLLKGDVVGVTMSDSGSLLIDVDNTLLGENVRLESDVVVLATGMVPSTLVDLGVTEEGMKEPLETTADGKKMAESAEAGAGILNLTYRQGTDLPTLKYGFPDSHFICFPYETRRTGIYAAGCVRSPMDFLSSREDAYGATLKAIQVILSVKEGRAVHPRSGDVSHPDFFLQRCTQCKRCTEECPFGTLDEDEKGTPLPNLDRCRRCGICLGACPERIISFSDYSVPMIAAMIKAVEIPEEDEEKPRILAFLCENDAYPALDTVGKLKIQYNPFVRVIPVRCLGSVNVVWIAEALSKGFDGILLIGCKYGEDYQCHFIKGSELASKRMDNVRDKLKQLALEPERVRLLTLSIDEYRKLPSIFDEFVEEIKEIGLNPYKGM